MRLKSSTSTTHCVRSAAIRVAGSSFALTRFFVSRAAWTVEAPGRPAGVGNGRSVGVVETGVDLTTPQADAAMSSSEVVTWMGRIRVAPVNSRSFAEPALERGEVAQDDIEQRTADPSLRSG
jgi:hypothetical protein